MYRGRRIVEYQPPQSYQYRHTDTTNLRLIYSYPHTQVPEDSQSDQTTFMGTDSQSNPKILMNIHIQAHIYILPEDSQSEKTTFILKCSYMYVEVHTCSAI